MIPSTGDYRIFLILLSQTTPDYITVVITLLADELTQVVLLVPRSFSAMEPYLTSLYLLLTVIIGSTICITSCAILLPSFGPHAIMALLFTSYFYPYVAVGCTFLCWFNFVSALLSLYLWILCSLFCFHE